jgi:hypothetical protein
MGKPIPYGIESSSGSDTVSDASHSTMFSRQHLIGVYVYSLQIISETETGLTLPSPIFAQADYTGLCPSSTNVADMAQQALRFGYDVSGGCMLQLTRYALANASAGMLTFMRSRNRQQHEDYCKGTTAYTSSNIPVFFSNVESSG